MSDYFDTEADLVQPLPPTPSAPGKLRAYQAEFFDDDQAEEPLVAEEYDYNPKTSSFSTINIEEIKQQHNVESVSWIDDIAATVAIYRPKPEENRANREVVEQVVDDLEYAIPTDPSLRCYDSPIKNPAQVGNVEINDSISELSCDQSLSDLDAEIAPKSWVVDSSQLDSTELAAPISGENDNYSQVKNLLNTYSNNGKNNYDIDDNVMENLSELEQLMNSQETVSYEEETVNNFVNSDSTQEDIDSGSIDTDSVTADESDNQEVSELLEDDLEWDESLEDFSGDPFLITAEIIENLRVKDKANRYTTFLVETHFTHSHTSAQNNSADSNTQDSITPVAVPTKKKFSLKHPRIGYLDPYASPGYEASDIHSAYGVETSAWQTSVRNKKGRKENHTENLTSTKLWRHINVTAATLSLIIVLANIFAALPAYLFTSVFATVVDDGTVLVPSSTTVALLSGTQGREIFLCYFLFFALFLLIGRYLLYGIDSRKVLNIATIAYAAITLVADYYTSFWVALIALAFQGSLAAVIAFSAIKIIEYYRKEISATTIFIYSAFSAIFVGTILAALSFIITQPSTLVDYQGISAVIILIAGASGMSAYIDRDIKISTKQIPNIFSAVTLIVAIILFVWGITRNNDHSFTMRTIVWALITLVFVLGTVIIDWFSTKPIIPVRDIGARSFISYALAALLFAVITHHLALFITHNIAIDHHPVSWLPKIVLIAGIALLGSIVAYYVRQLYGHKYYHIIGTAVLIVSTSVWYLIASGEQNQQSILHGITTDNSVLYILAISGIGIAIIVAGISAINAINLRLVVATIVIGLGIGLYWLSVNYESYPEGITVSEYQPTSIRIHIGGYAVVNILAMSYRIIGLLIKVLPQELIVLVVVIFLEVIAQFVFRKRSVVRVGSLASDSLGRVDNASKIEDSIEGGEPVSEIIALAGSAEHNGVVNSTISNDFIGETGEPSIELIGDVAVAVSQVADEDVDISETAGSEQKLS